MAETPEEAAAKVLADVMAAEVRGDNMDPIIASALRAQYVAGLERAAEIARAEADEYLRNAKACDASGNTFGGSMDTNGASACRRVDSRIRELAEQAKRAP